MRIKGLQVVRSGVLFRADDVVDTATDRQDGNLADMVVRFSPFDTWYEINSMWEGNFLERTVAGAFKNTINQAKRSDGRFSTKSLFNHGMDLHIGDKLLGVPDKFAEVNSADYHGPELNVPLSDTSYNRDLLPGLRLGGYGSSFMFETIRDEWNNEPEESDHNPHGIPERTIREARTFEAGPVTWPASPTATAGLRSLSGTDAWIERLQARSGARYDSVVRSMEAFRAMQKAVPDARLFTPTPDPVDDTELRRQVDEDMAQREATLRRARLMVLQTRSR